MAVVMEHESSGMLECLLQELHTDRDEQFASFIEALAGDSSPLEDGMTSSPDIDTGSPCFELDVDSRAAESPKSASSVSKHVPSSRWSCFVPRPAKEQPGRGAVDLCGARAVRAGPGDGTSVQSLPKLPTARETKMEKLRAKNRRNQQALRDRQRVLRRELEDKLQHTKQQLQASQVQWRRLRMERLSLQLRCSLDAHAEHAPPVPPRPQQPTCMPTDASASSSRGEAPPPQTIAVCNLGVAAETQSQMPGPKESVQRCVQEHMQLAQHRTQRGGHHQTKRPSQRPISSYKHHARMSFSDVSKYMTPQEFRSSCRFNFQELRNAIADYQAAVVAQLDTHVSDVCWFLEWPYEGFETPLSVSTSIASPECRLSVTAGHIAQAMECLFLIIEYEHLASASVPSYKGPEHPTLEESAAPHTAPSPPDPGVLAGTYLRCGTNQRVPAERALRALLEPLLERFRVLLPRRKWLAVCMQSMRGVQAVADVLRTATVETGSASERKKPVAGEESAGQHSTEQEGMHESSRIRSLLAVHELALVVIHNAVRRTLAEETKCERLGREEGCAPAGRTFAQINSRLFSLVGALYCFATLFMQAEPETSRRLLITQFLSSSERGTLRAQRLQMKLYKQLQLHADQRAAMAERWRSWYRRRRGLDLQMSSALCALQGSLPSGCVHARLHALLCAQPSEPETKTLLPGHDPRHPLHGPDSLEHCDAAQFQISPPTPGNFAAQCTETNTAAPAATDVCARQNLAASALPHRTHAQHRCTDVGGGAKGESSEEVENTAAEDDGTKNICDRNGSDAGAVADAARAHHSLYSEAKYRALMPVMHASPYDTVEAHGSGICQGSLNFSLSQLSFADQKAVDESASRGCFQGANEEAHGHAWVGQSNATHRPSRGGEQLGRPWNRSDDSVQKFALPETCVRGGQLGACDCSPTAPPVTATSGACKPVAFLSTSRTCPQSMHCAEGPAEPTAAQLEEPSPRVSAVAHPGIAEPPSRRGAAFEVDRACMGPSTRTAPCGAVEGVKRGQHPACVGAPPLGEATATVADGATPARCGLGLAQGSRQAGDAITRDGASRTHACDACMSRCEALKQSEEVSGTVPVDQQLYERAGHAQVDELEGVGDDASQGSDQGCHHGDVSACEAGSLQGGLALIRDAPMWHSLASPPAVRPEPPKKRLPMCPGASVQDCGREVFKCPDILDVHGKHVQNACGSRGLVSDKPETVGAGASDMHDTALAQPRARAASETQKGEEAQPCCDFHLTKAIFLPGGAASEAPGVFREREQAGDLTRPPGTAWDISMVRPEDRTLWVLGESGSAYSTVQAAVRDVLDVHQSDGLMHYEFWGPFWELTEAAAAEERRDALFGGFL